MYKTLAEIYSLLTVKQRHKFIRLQLLVIVMALLEVISVMSVGPFMGLVADPEQIETSIYLKTIYEWIGVDSHNTFLIIIGGLSISLLTLAVMVSVITVWQLSMYGVHVGAALGSRLFDHYMAQPWLFHASTNSSQHNNKIINECGRISTGIILPFLNLNAKLILALVMTVTIFLYNPLIAVIGVCFFAGAYLCLYSIIKHRLSRCGEKISAALSLRMRLLHEGFGGIKDTMLFNRQASFTSRFDAASYRAADALGISQVFTQIPRYVMEFLALSTVILLILFLLYTNDHQLGLVLPALTIYALAGLKLLPAFQQIYSSSSCIRSNLSAFEVLREDLIKSQAVDTELNQPEKQVTLALRSNLVLSTINFRYPKADKETLSNVNINITVNSTVGFAGSSGGGKSTLVDIVLGLLEPNSGSLLVDGQVIDASNVKRWQRNIAFVPQQIYLADTSIKSNVAFGMPEEEINIERVHNALKKASLGKFVASLPEGLETTVGEHGVQLSGGQRQRIGIARALYRSNFSLIVFDEATSSLDGITEQAIMSTLQAFSGKKTIILIAHRLSTLKHCNIIYLIEAGKIVDSGTFDELEARNSLFFREIDIKRKNFTKK